MASVPATKITGLSVRDIRFPTSLESDGSDAVHVDPDYSCAYVVLHTDSIDLRGYGLSFTIGRGTEVVVSAIESYRNLVVGRELDDIYKNFGDFWKSLANDSQLRWLGPEKGVIHLALGAIVNALWDLRARMENKPLWKLLVDMDPKELISTIDFRYIRDVITEEEALDMLQKQQEGKAAREEELKKHGYPAYSTHAGWLGYSDEKLEKIAKSLLQEGFTSFKVKVGLNLEEDKRRLGLMRKVIGEDKLMMVDANQVWDVDQAIPWVRELAPYNLLWIEEPTSPDDILGHARIAKEGGVGVATGEQCHNRVMFKQFLQAEALQYCQIDACRLGGVSEVLAVYLMAAKFNVPVCPHAGGVGLCEMVQHLAMWDYVSLSGSLHNRMVEFVDHLHQHFTDPVMVKHGHYMPPQQAGYSCQMKEDSLRDHEFPNSPLWQKLLNFDKRYARQNSSGMPFPLP